MVGCFALLLGATQRVQSQRKLNVLLQSGGGDALPRPYNPQEITESNAHARELYKLWQARDERDVTAEVIPFLQDPHASVRGSAVRVLARLNTLKAEEALSQALAQQLKNTQSQQVQPNAISPLELRFAVGRISSRDLKGRERIEAFAQSAGLSFADVVALSHKVNDQRSSLTQDTAADRVVIQVVDLLSAMGREGEDIEPMVKQLTLNPAQQVQLKAATLSPDKGSKVIINYLAGLDIVTGDDIVLSRSLLLNPESISIDLLVQKLTALKNGKEKHGQRGYVEIFRTAALTGDARVLPLLKEFEQNTDSIMRYYAIQSRLMMEQQAWFPPLP